MILRGTTVRLTPLDSAGRGLLGYTGKLFRFAVPRGYSSYVCRPDLRLLRRAALLRHVYYIGHCLLLQPSL